jgi:HAMP domain-containing protein
MKKAKKHAASTVALDRSLVGQAAAVAVDGRGSLVAWTVASEGGNAGTLARQALRELQVRPREVRVLLGTGTGAGDEAQVAVLDHPGAPGEGEILAALFADGYPRLSEPSVAAVAISPGTWLVAACGAAVIEPLAAGLLEESGTEPAFVVDQLLGEEGLKAGSAVIETGEPLPAACALAWRLALRPTVTRLASGRSERRRASLAWARRATHVAMILAVLGVLAMAAGLRLAWGSRARSRALASQAAGDARLVQELREIGALAGEAKRLRAELAGRTAPWPRVAEAVAALARLAPPETGWERLQIKEGALELEASALGAAPEARLDLLRQALERSPRLANLSWGAPATDHRSPRLRQVFRAAVREAPAAVQGVP